MKNFLEQKYQFLVDNILDTIIELDLKGNFVYISPQCFDTFGYHQNELMGTILFEIIHPEDLSSVKESILDTIKSRKTISAEFRIKHKNGNYVYISAKGSLVNANGTQTILAVGRDITKEKRIENILKESEAKYRLIIENVNDMIFILNEKFEFEYINEDVFKKLIGYTKEDLIGKPSIENIHPEDIKKISRDLFKDFKTSKETTELRIKNKNGSYQWHEIRGQTIIDVDGKKKALLIGRDITERKKAEEKLKQSEAIFNNITDQTFMGFAIFQDFEIKYFNPAFSEAIGYSQEEILSWKAREFFNIIYPDDKNKLISLAQKLYSGDNESLNFLQFRINKKSGQLVWVETQTKTVIYEGKKADMVFIQNITPKMEAEQKIKESEEKYRVLFESSPYAVGLINAKGVVVQVNSNVEKIFGYKKEELLGKAFRKFRLFSKEHRKNVLESFNKLIKGEIPEPQELQLHRKDGNVIWVSMQASIVKLQNELLFQVITQDISEQKKAEEKLKKSEEKYRLITEHANDLIDVLNEKFQYEYINEATHKRVLGYSKEDMIGKFAGNFVHPDDMKDIVEKLREGFAKGVESTECRIRKKDGTYIWYESKGNVFRDQYGNKKALILSRDITERKLAEIKLKESEENYRLLFENSIDGIWVVDSNTKTSFINPSMADMLGYDVREVLGESVLNFIPENEKNKILHALQKRKKGIKEVIERTFIHKNGKEVYTKLRASPLFDTNGNFKGALAFIENISERKKAEKKLRESEKKFRILFEGANDAIFVADEEIKIIEANNKALEIYGYDNMDEFIGLNAWELSPLKQPDGQISREIGPKHLKEILGGVSENIYWQHKRKDGTLFDSETSLSRIILNGRYYIQAIVRDISEQLKAKKKLKESEEKYRLISENANDLIVTINKNSIIEYVNKRPLLRYFGYTPEEIIGKDIKYFINPNYLESYGLKNVKNLFQKEKGVIELELRHKKNYYCPVEVSVSIFIDMKGEPKQLIFIRDITGRKRVEQKLKESEEKYRLISEDADDLISLYDENFNLEYINQQTHSRILGYSVESLNDLAFKMSITHRDDVKTITTASRDCFKKEKVTYQMRLKHKNGQYLWFETRGKVFSGQNNKKKILYVSRDITERKNSEEELKAKELKYRTLIENLPQRIFLKDKNFMYISCNNKYAEDLNIKADDILGKTDYNFYPKELADKYRTDDIRILSTGEAEEIDEMDILKGQETYVRTIKTPIRDKNGNITGLLGIFWDITERKKVEKQLKESEERFKIIFEHAPEAYYLNDLKGEFVDGNKAAENLIGYRRDDLIGINIVKILPESQLPIALDLLSKNKRGLKTGPEEIIITHKDGREIPVELRSHPITINNQALVLGIARDITERKKAERRLKESEEKFRSLFKGGPLFTLAWRKVEDDFLLVDYNNNAKSITKGQIRYDVGNIASEMYLKDQYRPDIIEDLNRCFEEKSNFTEEKKFYVDFMKRERNLRIMCNYVPPDLVLTHIEDITGRKRAEQKLRESEEKYRNIIENAKEGYFEVDLKGNFTLCNDALCKLFEYPAEELIGMNYKNYTNEEMSKRVFIAFNTAYKTGIEKESFDYEVITKNSKTIYGETTIHLRYDSEGNKVGFSGFLRDVTEKKIAEQKLKESEETLRTLFEVTPVSIVLSDLESNIIMCNQKFCEIHGIENPDLVKGRKIPEFISKKDRPKLRDSIKKTFGEIHRGSKEYMMIREDGTEFQAEATSAGIRDKNGKIIGLIGVAQDITERKRAEEKLKESEEKFRHLFEHSPFSIVLFDSSGMIIDCNSATEKIFGFEKQEIINENYMNLSELNPKQLIILKERFQSLMNGDDIEPLELRVIRKDGNVRWINSSVSKVRIKNSTLFYSIIQDITERKILENLMFELNQVFFNFTADVKKNIQLLLQTVSNLSKGKIVLYTRKFFDKDKKQVAQLITSENEFYSHNADIFKKIYFMSKLFEQNHELPQIFLNLHENNQLRGDPFIQKYNIRGAYGKIINSQDDYESAISILYQQNPEVADEDQLVLLLVSDAIAIEEQRWQLLQKLEEQNKKLSEIDKLKSEFLTRISHELKTPLISIKGYSELILLQNEDYFDIDTISMIEEIIQGCSRLENLIIELLKTSKLETGQIELKTSMEDLSFLIKFTIKELQGLIRSRSQKIVLNIHDNLITRFEKERVHEIIGNLLTNAIKYTPPFGTVEIKTEIKENFYIISVKDNGIGFTEKESENLFKQFGKIEHYGRGSYISTEGTGLGLYITKKLVELHGGEIWMESEGRNKGSIFYFSLPIIKE